MIKIFSSPEVKVELPEPEVDRVEPDNGTEVEPSR